MFAQLRKYETIAVREEAVSMNANFETDEATPSPPLANRSIVE